MGQNGSKKKILRNLCFSNRGTVLFGGLKASPGAWKPFK
jgi:hypothetical protein